MTATIHDIDEARCKRDNPKAQRPTEMPMTPDTIGDLRNRFITRTASMIVREMAEKMDREMLGNSYVESLK